MDVWSPSYDLFPPPLGQGVWGAKPARGFGWSQVPQPSIRQSVTGNRQPVSIATATGKLAVVIKNPKKPSVPELNLKPNCYGNE